MTPSRIGLAAPPPSEEFSHLTAGATAPDAAELLETRCDEALNEPIVVTTARSASVRGVHKGPPLYGR